MKLMDVYYNQVLVCALLSWVVAQVSKIIIMLIKDKAFHRENIFTAGGMPSTHAATVTALATAIGRVEGFGTPLFAAAFIMAAIVCYDAAGVRYNAGQHAVIINKLVDKLDIPEIEAIRQKELKEKLGHTVLQVIVGIAIGILVASLFPFSE